MYKSVLLFLSVFVSSVLLAQPSDTFTSQFPGGDWTNNSSWVGSAPSATITKTTEINILAGHSITLTSLLDVKNNVTINIYGTLNLSGGVQADNNLVFNVAAGGVLNMAGDLNANNNSDITFEGVGVIAGSIIVKNNTNLTVNGNLTVSGDIQGENPANNLLLGSGALVVTGNMSGFDTSGFTGTINGALPVSLTYFNVQNNGGTVALNWKTASEKNNDYFVIEGSIDMIEWHEIAVVDGNGTTSVASEYSAEDEVTVTGTYYYRLVQYDFDGSATVFNTEELNCCVGLSNVAVYPNPTSDYLHVTGAESFSIINNQQAVVYKETIETDKAVADLSDFPKGTYIVKLEFATHVESVFLLVK